MGQPSTKAKILEVLRNAAGREVSGERLAEICLVSRVAIWKHIHDLIASGYPIKASKTGYIYEQADDDFLFPAEFGELEALVTHVDETPSTMDIAREKALAGAPDGTIIIAETQTNGRGRNKRPWVSPKGSLLFTLLLRPYEPITAYYAKIQASHYALAETLATLLPHTRVSVKWPNDILINGKKAGGILAEAFFSSDTVAWLNVGIGLNVKNPAPLKAATSLVEHGGVLPSRTLILKKFLQRFRAIECTPETISGLETRFALFGKPCMALLSDGSRLHGKVDHVDEFGRAYFIADGNSGTVLLLDPSKASIRYDLEDFS